MELPNDIGTGEDLCNYRIDAAKATLKAAQVLNSSKMYKDANNRAYYAMLYAMNAVHALKGVSYKKHKDVIANFNQEYVKTEVFPKELGRRINNAEEIRHASDYDDFYIASADEAEGQIKLAAEMIMLVEEYVKSSE